MFKNTCCVDMLWNMFDNKKGTDTKKKKNPSVTGQFLIYFPNKILIGF